jgi:hypothetical protein
MFFSVTTGQAPRYVEVALQVPNGVPGIQPQEVDQALEPWHCVIRVLILRVPNIEFYDGGRNTLRVLFTEIEHQSSKFA